MSWRHLAPLVTSREPRVTYKSHVLWYPRSPCLTVTSLIQVSDVAVALVTSAVAVAADLNHGPADQDGASDVHQADYDPSSSDPCHSSTARPCTVVWRHRGDALWRHWWSLVGLTCESTSSSTVPLPGAYSPPPRSRDHPYWWRHRSTRRKWRQRTSGGSCYPKTSSVLKELSIYQSICLTSTETTV